MSGEECAVDRFLRTLTVSDRKIVILASGEPASKWHPLLRDLFRCATIDLMRIIEGEEGVFELIAGAPSNADLANLAEFLDLPADPDGPAPAA